MTDKPKVFFHGSPIGGIQELEPRIDPRTGRKALFVDTSLVDPEIFSLMPERHKFSKDSHTRNGKLIEGKVTGPELLNEGFIYKLKPDPNLVSEFEPGQFVVTGSTKPISSKRVSREKVMSRGWKHIKTASYPAFVDELEKIAGIARLRRILISSAKKENIIGGKVNKMIFKKHYPGLDSAGERAMSKMSRRLRKMSNKEGLAWAKKHNLTGEPRFGKDSLEKARAINPKGSLL